MHIRRMILVAIAALVSPACIANAQCDTSGECFCDASGMVGIAQLIRAVNIALGQAACPSGPTGPCTCCACDFGEGDVQCGGADIDCVECVSSGGIPAADCSVCNGVCDAGQTLCEGNPQGCQMTEPCTCCACDFGDGDIECGDGDASCGECLDLGGSIAADCSVCSDVCDAGQTLCLDSPQECRLPAGCGCCACDFGVDGVQCGTGDTNCEECVAVGGSPAAECSVCEELCSAGETLCQGDPQECLTAAGAKAGYFTGRSYPTNYSTAAPAKRAGKSGYTR